MLMVRNSHRLLCSTNNELLCGASFAKMPLFESTGVGRRQRSLWGMVLSRRFSENRNRSHARERGTWMTGGSDRTAHENRSKHITKRVDERFTPQKVVLKQSVHPLRRATHEKENPACPIDQQPGAEEQDDRCHGVLSISKLKRHNKADIRCVAHRGSVGIEFECISLE